VRSFAAPCRMHSFVTAVAGIESSAPVAKITSAPVCMAMDADRLFVVSFSQLCLLDFTCDPSRAKVLCHSILFCHSLFCRPRSRRARAVVPLSFVVGMTWSCRSVALSCDERHLRGVVATLALQRHNGALAPYM